MSALLTNCKTVTQITSGGGRVINNSDGTISVFTPTPTSQLQPSLLTKPCCEALGITGAYFDIDTQKCRWTSAGSQACTLDSVFKLVLNPKGNDGSLFYVDGVDEQCYLTIDFDYLFKFDCNTLSKLGTTTNNSSTAPSGGSAQLLFPFLPTNGGTGTGTGVGGTSVINPTQDIGGSSTGTQTATCQQLQNQLNLLNLQLATTLYSIKCNSSTATSIPVYNTPITTAPFQNTGFGGGLSPSISVAGSSSTSTPSTTSVNGKTFCLTEPSGLNKWATILGPVKYQKFLNGDATSYTCTDVQTIFDANENNNHIYLTNCTTPFGTKTQLLQSISALSAQLAACNATTSLFNPILNISAGISGGSSSGSTPSVSGTCTNPVQALESLDVSMTLEVINTSPTGTTMTTVYEGPVFSAIGVGHLYTYMSSHSGNTGFFICGDPVTGDPPSLKSCSPLNFDTTNSRDNVYSCNVLKGLLNTELFNESGLPSTAAGMKTFNDAINNDGFSSNWLHFSSIITNTTILNKIKNKKIKITLKVNNTCIDLCVLVDNIKLDKVCTNTENTSLHISKSPGFELDRIRDNKKSWIKNTTFVNRDFDITRNDGTIPIRLTNYDVNDERLVINTKEIDLDMSLASAIETDVWCYMVDNECMLTGCTNPPELVCCEPSCVTVAGISSTSTTITISGTPSTPAKHTFPVSCQGGGANIIYLTGNTIGVASGLTSGCGVVNDFTNSMNLLVNSINTNTPQIPVLPTFAGYPAYNNSAGFTAVYSATSQTTGNLIITAPVGSGTLYNGIGIGFYTQFFGGTPPSSVFFAGGTSGTPSSSITTTVTAMTSSTVCTTTVETSSCGCGTLGTGATGTYLPLWSPSTWAPGPTINVVLFFTFGPPPIILSGQTSMSGTMINAAITINSVPTYSNLMSAVWNGTTLVIHSKVLSASTNSWNGIWSASGSQPILINNPSFGFSGGADGTPAPSCCGDDCVDYTKLLTQSVTGITVVEDFEILMTSELIDAKDRKTLSAYPTLRGVYDRYMNNNGRCNTTSSRFDYDTIDQFANLVGNYWVDIVEQVVPATTIWGSTRIYSNSIFDQQKFKYKGYTLQLGGNPFSGNTVLSPVTACTTGVSAITITIGTGITTTHNYTKVCIAQMNSGSEFIGNVSVVGSGSGSGSIPFNPNFQIIHAP